MVAAIEELSAIPISDPVPACLAPWLKNPYRLATWFDVLHFSAERFAWAWRQLRIIRADLLINCAVCLDGEVAFHVARDLGDETRDTFLSSAATLEKSFRSIGLTITADTIKELHDELEKNERHTSEWLSSRVDGIERLATKELKGRLFLYVPEEKAKFWPTNGEPFAFGKEVADNFPSTTFDANSAAICLACSQGTAAAFHLMRVLEIGLRVLADHFSIASDRQNWQNIIEGIEKAVRNLPNDPKRTADWKDQQEFFSGAAMQFMFFKDAWRNYVAHGRDKCTEDEAERILTSVRAFMQKLATRLHE